MEERYPKVIEGDLLVDNFFDCNTEVSFYPQMKKLVEEEGRDRASNIMWSFFILKDPRSFYYDKMTILERRNHCIKEYFDLNFEEYKWVEEFYEDKILINEDILHYIQLLKKFEIAVATDPKYTVQKATADKESLIIFKHKAMSVLNQSENLRVQGKKQPGMLARTKIF